MDEDIVYTSNHSQGLMAIAQALGEIQFWERMRTLMPMVAAELVKSGVVFPKEALNNGKEG